MLAALEKAQQEFKDLEKRLSDPEVLKDIRELQRLAKRHAELRGLVEKYQNYLNTQETIRETEELARSEDELAEIAGEELEKQRGNLERLEREIQEMLIPKDPTWDKNAIVEIRAGTGGEEAALFARDLFVMYSRFAERQGWKCEVLSANHTGRGGIKEVIFAVEGDGAFGILSYESGVHRVQRIPVTESGGRIHTSAASVAVLLEAEEIDIKIDPQDLEIKTFHASGAGGQHVQKNETAVRITHKPTGTVVTCEDERSQLQNKLRALRILRSELLEQEQQRQQAQISETRRRQIKSGDRSEKIRTYNFPQGRITDHRINLSLYSLDRFLEGEIDGMLEALRKADKENLLTSTP